MDGPFYSFNSVAAEEIEKGIWTKSLTAGAVQVRHMVFESGCLIPDHRHPEEVVTMILEGEMEMTVDGETKTVKSGDVFLVPQNTGHSGRVISKDRVIAISWATI